ncbi:MAG: type II-A CRISPR-associated protein Csn2 [Bacteroides sp.]|nr:type II-A CRISPR-associated protein Csn2 [Bacillota bacterium]MCM1455545.1 type II-A CRISPR-associated protein Csn2 [Bacteroides sp.]
MKLAHYNFDTPFEWTGHNVCSLVIENPKFYREIVAELFEQSQIGEGEFVLSDENKIIEFDKNSEIIGNLFDVDICSNKTVINAIIKEAAECAANRFSSELADMYKHINQVLSDICFESASELTFDEINDITLLLKAYHLRPDIEQLSFAERLISYMEICQKYAKKRLFITINLRACLSDEDAESFYNSLVYRKINLLSIECANHKNLACEKRKTIDEDLCEL